MKNRMVSLLLALVLLFGMTACAGGSQISAEQPQKAPTAVVRSFTDDCGRTVELPAEISRIVPSGPLSQIVLFAVAPEMFVGLASRWGERAEGIIPDAYYSLPYMGQLYGSADLNIEELAAAAPQLIVDVGEAKKSIVSDMDELQAQTTIPSVHIEASLETMPEAFRRLGVLLGREEKAERLAEFCEQVYSRSLDVMAQVGENRVRAMYVLGEDGMNVLARGSYHAELLDFLTENAAVVENPAGKGTGNAVTMEQIALWNPDFVIFAPGSIYDTAAERGVWKEISAIASGRYVEVPEGPHNWMGNPPSVQRYLALIWLTAELYPEYCSYDVKAEIMEYYRLFYGCTLTEEQYGTLTARAVLK